MKKTYTFTKLMINFILINIVINGIFYFIGFMNHEGVLSLSATQNDLLFGLVILGIFCSYTGFLTRKDLITGKVDLDEIKQSRLHKFLPESNLLRTLILTGFVIVIIFSLFSYAPRIFGVNQINHFIGFMNKTVSAALAAGIIGYIVVSLSFEDYRSMSKTGGSL